MEAGSLLSSGDTASLVVSRFASFSNPLIGQNEGWLLRMKRSGPIQCNVGAVRGPAQPGL